MTSWDLLYWILRANFDGEDGGGYVQPPEGAVKAKTERRARYRNGCAVTSLCDASTADGRVDVTFTNAEGCEKVQQADLVIAADGPSSSIRSLFCPQVERTYAGYCAWRGTVPESELSKEAYQTLVERFTFFHAEGTQVLCYVIPGAKGTLEKGERLVNWVWYRNAVSENEKARFLTDKEGVVHHSTLPVGSVHPDVWDETKKIAREVLPPQFAELVDKTEMPFCQAVTDVLSPGCVFIDGRVVLVGDAVAGFRPHTAASTSQAAFHAMGFAEVVKGEMDLEEWKEEVMEFARETQRSGVMMGERSQFGRHPLAR